MADINTGDSELDGKLNEWFGWDKVRLGISAIYIYNHNCHDCAPVRIILILFGNDHVCLH